MSEFNMVLDNEGAGVFLEDRHGVRTEVIVDEVESKQFFKAHSAMLLESGDYKLVVKSRAGDPEGPLQVRSKNVKYLRVLPPPPTVTGVQCGENEPNVLSFLNGKLTISGQCAF